MTKYLSSVKKILLSHKYTFLITVILFLFTLYAGKGLFEFATYTTHDGNHHVARTYDAIQTLKEGHLPLRWAGSLNYECGVPIYNFFYPLYYYILGLMGIISGERVLLSIKVLGFASMFLGSFFFYIWMIEETKDKLASFVASTLYLFAPYRFSLIYVRGSPEYIAYTILPLVLYFYSKALNDKKKINLYLFAATITGGILAISHNFAAMFLLPLILLYLLFKLWQNKEKKENIIKSGLSFISIFLVASFFIGPALLEKQYTKIGGDSVIKFAEQFPTLRQLLRSKWDYFYSNPGTVNDGMSFMLGYAQWIVILVSTATFILSFIKAKNKKEIYANFNFIAFIGLLLLTAFSIFMMLQVSLPVWNIIGFAKDIQFPWRLLGVSVFLVSMLSAYLLLIIRDSKLRYLFSIFIVILSIVGNRNHLRVKPASIEENYMYSNFEKLHYNRYTTTTLGDDVIYKNAPQACYFTTPWVKYGQEEPKLILNKRANTYGLQEFEVKGKTNNQIQLRLGYFPNMYQFNLNGTKVKYQECEGRVCVGDEQLKSGINTIEWKVVQTPIQKAFNILSIITLLAWIFFLAKGRRKTTVIIFLLLIFALAHFINFGGRTIFNWDEERDAIQVTNILHGHFTLIGPVANATGFFQPPYYFYLLTPFYAMFAGSPLYSLLTFKLFIEIFFLLSSFFIIKKIGNLSNAIFFVFLWLLLPLSWDTIVWNPALIPLFTIVFIYSLYRYFQEPTKKNFVVSSLVFSLATTFHIQGLFLFPLFFVAFLKDGFNKIELLKKILIIIVSMVLIYLPILLFDVRHNFLNLKLLLQLFGKDNVVPFTIISLYEVWNNFSSLLLGVGRNILNGAIFYILLILSISLSIKTTIKNSFLRSIFVSFLLIYLTVPILLYIYHSRPSEYYFNFVYVIFIFTLSHLFSKVVAKGKVYLGIVLLVLTLVFTHYISFYKSNLQSIPNSLNAKRKVIDYIKTLDADSKFDISYKVPLSEDSGFRYLLNREKINSGITGNKPLLEIVYPRDSCNSLRERVVGAYCLLLP